MPGKNGMTSIAWFVLVFYLNGPQQPHALPARYDTAKTCADAVRTLRPRYPLDQGLACKPHVLAPLRFVYVLPGARAAR